MTTKLRCILIDDDIFSIEMLKDYMKDLQNVEIIACFNAPERFLEALPYLDFNLVFLDIIMPEIDGFEVAKHLVNKSIIFLTGDADKYSEEAAKFYPLAIISKPYRKELLRESIIKAESVILN